MRTAACAHCNADALVGHDHCGVPITVDPAPLTIRGEALAVLAGRGTYAIEPGGWRESRQAHYRQPSHIGQRSPYPIHADHVCGRPIPDDLTAPTAQADPGAWQTPEEIPF